MRQKTFSETRKANIGLCESVLRTDIGMCV